ncbi:hypothetical protein RE428_35540 [Marinobacter nanhaiticus D15-8W]|nr:hypothetical protein RE428_35540 [Marinobacter nanhaiticus D15-8W]
MPAGKGFNDDLESSQQARVFLLIDSVLSLGSVLTYGQHTLGRLTATSACRVR